MNTCKRGLGNNQVWLCVPLTKAGIKAVVSLLAAALPNNWLLKIFSQQNSR